MEDHPLAPPVLDVTGRLQEIAILLVQLATEMHTATLMIIELWNYYQRTVGVQTKIEELITQVQAVSTLVKDQIESSTRRDPSLEH